MISDKVGIKIWDLKAEAWDELYLFIDKHYKKMLRNSDGSIKSSDPSYDDNDIDVLRHSYVSAVYVIEFSYETSELLGRLNEFDPRKNEIRSRNMDLWNNSIGRGYGKKSSEAKNYFLLF